MQQYDEAAEEEVHEDEKDGSSYIQISEENKLALWLPTAHKLGRKAIQVVGENSPERERERVGKADRCVRVAIM